MSKAVLISVHPKWCEKIAIREKTIEVRKSRPKIETPFKCYIYQTKHKWMCDLLRSLGKEALADKLENALCKVIGEFICDTIHKYGTKNIYGKYCIPKKIWQMSCLSWEELDKYAGVHDLYCLHISDLVIYDKPKELTSFRKPCKKYGADCDMCVLDHTKCSNAIPIERPPQSWCYVEELS